MINIIRSFCCFCCLECECYISHEKKCIQMHLVYIWKHPRSMILFQTQRETLKFLFYHKIDWLKWLCQISKFYAIQMCQFSNDSLNQFYNGNTRLGRTKKCSLVFGHTNCNAIKSLLVDTLKSESFEKDEIETQTNKYLRWMHLNISFDAFSVHRSLMTHDINTIASHKLKIERERE